MGNGHAGVGVSTNFGGAWERFMAAERKALEKRKAGILARAIGKELPGESR